MAPANLDPLTIASAEVVLPARPFAATLAFFIEQLGFRITMVEPADDPVQARIFGHGITVCLLRDAVVAPGLIRLHVFSRSTFAGQGELVAPNGTRIEMVQHNQAIELPPLCASFVVARIADSDAFRDGRAGMRYRDLIPGRQGGRYLASHIRIPIEGPVADYVHFHRVHLQLLYCWRGAAQVVYEDQGGPFWLRAGDCVLQPPTIRHRVLQTEGICDVIELACPARHETVIDHELALPTQTVRHDRSFCGQTFVHAQAATAQWEADGVGVQRRDLGSYFPTNGQLVATVMCRSASAAPLDLAHEGDLQFLFVLRGGCSVHGELLTEGDAITVPPHEACSLLPTGGEVLLLLCAVQKITDSQ